MQTSREDWQREAASGHLFAVVDSCDEPCVPKKVAEAGPDRAISLYRGGNEEQYSNVAPYLFRVDQTIFDWIVKDLWAKPWGIFAFSSSGLEELRHHLRHFLTVKGTDGKKYLLRFYDPRILPAFVGSCNEMELKQFFGPVQKYGATKEGGVWTMRLQEENRV